MVGDEPVMKEIRTESTIFVRKQENTPNTSHWFITTTSAAGKTGQFKAVSYKVDSNIKLPLLP
jgi:hypothetical protein